MIARRTSRRATAKLSATRRDYRPSASPPPNNMLTCRGRCNAYVPRETKMRPRSSSPPGSLASCARIPDFLDASSQVLDRQLCIKLLNEFFGKRLLCVNVLHRREIHAPLVVVFGPRLVRSWLAVEDRKQGRGAIRVGTTRE